MSLYYKGTSTTSWQAKTFKMLTKRHNSHQEELPGNTDPDCPVCMFNTGTLYKDKDGNPRMPRR